MSPSFLHKLTNPRGKEISRWFIMTHCSHLKKKTLLLEKLIGVSISRQLYASKEIKAKENKCNQKKRKLGTFLVVQW